MCKQTLSEDVKTALRLPSFDAYEWEDWEILRLMETMFIELNLIEAFHISPDTLREWLYEVYKYYNDVPFHNFRHCFCVAQMVSYFSFSFFIFHHRNFHTEFSTFLPIVFIINNLFNISLCSFYLKARVAVPYVVCSLAFPRFSFFPFSYAHTHTNTAIVVFFCLFFVCFSVFLFKNYLQNKEL